MKLFYFFLIATTNCIAACSQQKAQSIIENKPQSTDLIVGGQCEGCEGIYESPVAFSSLKPIDTLPDFFEEGPKIEISGTVYQLDGVTPASDIVMYLYHTDQDGFYSKGSKKTEWSQRHGYIRGWLKTDKNGFYKFYTLIPASYPNTTIVKHIHPTIKEPGKTAYWIDDFVFDDDPFLTEKEKNKKYPVAGNGVLKPIFEDGILKATRNIILGLNVTSYPKN